MDVDILAGVHATLASHEKRLDVITLDMKDGLGELHRRINGLYRIGLSGAVVLALNLLLVIVQLLKK